MLTYPLHGMMDDVVHIDGRRRIRRDANEIMFEWLVYPLPKDNNVKANLSKDNNDRFYIDAQSCA